MTSIGDSVCGQANGRLRDAGHRGRIIRIGRAVTIAGVNDDFFPVFVIGSSTAADDAFALTWPDLAGAGFNNLMTISAAGDVHLRYLL